MEHHRGVAGTHPAIAEGMRELTGARSGLRTGIRRGKPRYALRRSELAWTCAISDVPAFMWGVARQGNLMSVTGAPWLLGTPAIVKVRHDFLRYCPHFVDAMQSAFPRLENFVHVENRLSIRWLKHLGFTVDEEMPEVMNGEDFYLFWRGAECVSQ